MRGTIKENTEEQKMKRAYVIVLLIAAALIAACSLIDTQSASYADYGAVEATGAIGRGWIPAFLPESATDVREKHNLDTNTELVRFDFDARDLGTLTQACPPTQDIVPPTLNANWWPDDLQDSVGAFFRCEGAGAYLAVDATNMRAYFWRP
jgi:hypothetical protein